jgi:hypothetical protein
MRHHGPHAAAESGFRRVNVTDLKDGQGSELRNVASPSNSSAGRTLDQDGFSSEGRLTRIGTA